MNIPIHLASVFFDHPEIISFGLENRLAEGAGREVGIPTHHGSSQIERGEQGGSFADLSPNRPYLHLGQHHSLLWQIGSQQMHTLALAQRDGPFQGFAIQTEVAFSRLGCGAQLLAKELPQHPLQLFWINGLSHDPAPGAVVRHLRVSEMEQLLQFPAAQLRPVSQRSTARLACQFGQDSDQQDLGQRILPALFPTSVFDPS